MITISEISLKFADKVIFDGISLFIRDSDRIGVVGDNGTGKTTFLRCLLDEVYLDKGNIEIRSGKTTAYLSQEATELPEITVLEFMRRSSGISEIEKEMKRLEKDISVCDHESKEYEQILNAYSGITHEFEIKGGYSFDAEAKRILSGLGFKNDDFSRLCTEFSGGWKIRINLAVVLSKRADILLLDEPTNHLDSESMEWLESYLKDHQGAIITVSHDRRFLDKMVSKILELKRGKFELYSGNYSFYLKEKERRLEALKKEYEAQQGEIKRIQDFIDRFRSKASKAPQVQSRIKMLEKFDVIELENESKKVKIKFPETVKSGNEVIKADGLAKSYGELQVFSDVNFTVYRGEKIAVVGKNGAGKSTLFKILAGETEPSGGSFEFGLNVSPAYFSQESADNLNTGNNIWEEIRACDTAENDTRLRTLLGAFLFSGNDIYKPISVLSGGEKSRLALLKILLSKSNLLILDEPTNHLDAATKNLFQQALLSFDGTIIIVSHDRYFLDELAGKVYEIKDGALRIIEGNYSYYIEKRDRAAEDEVKNGTVKETDEPAQTFKSKEQKRAEAELRNRMHKETKYYKEKLTAVEEEIDKMETRKAEIETLLSAGSPPDPEAVIGLSREIGELEVGIAYKMDEWADLNEKLEQKMESFK
ncbi:MAG TPA: ABC-F family ATP-binding cassette domain-containing protein [Clostridiales bacterium]|nr:ABC-F family ATP-binding cassette domain-containing protein [Clostridiales bacterium]